MGEKSAFLLREDAEFSVATKMCVFPSLSPRVELRENRVSVTHQRSHGIERGARRRFVLKFKFDATPFDFASQKASQTDQK